MSVQNQTSASVGAETDSKGKGVENSPNKNTNSSIIAPKCEYLNIPAELREKNNWVVHRNKVPYNVKSGQPDKNNPAEWASFEEAAALSVAGDYDGIN